MKVDVSFTLYLVGVFAMYSSVIGVYVLVSSLNVEGGLGTWSLALAYSTSLVAASITPFIGYLVGCKNLLLISQIGFLLFLLGNSYTSYYTVLPAGFFLGLSEAWAWTVMPIITTYFAEKQANTVPGNKEKHVRYYIGYYYGVINASAVVGSAISFVILGVDRTFSNTYNGTQTQSSDYSFCGANDCQIHNITQAHIQQYEPTFPLTRYLMIALYSFIMICAIVVHSIYLPKDIEWDSTAKEEINKTKRSKNCNESLGVTQQPACDEDCIHIASCAVKKNENVVSKKEVPLSAVFKTTFMATLKLSFMPKHLFVLLLPIYSGMTAGFCLGELTRAYTSCMLGVDKVGVCMMAYSFTNCIFSLIAGKVAGKFGRNLPYFFAFVVDIALYVFCFSWQVNSDNVWFVYLLFLLFGCSGGVWQTLNTALYGEYFIEQQKVAYNLWNVITNVGYLIQYSISTALCVYMKIYIQIGTLVIAIFAYGASQWVYYPTNLCPKKSKENASKEEQDATGVARNSISDVDEQTIHSDLQLEGNV